MKRFPILMIVSTLVVGLAGCQQCNWFKRSSGAVCSAPATTYMAPSAMAPAITPAQCGPGCNSCGSTNTLPVLSAPQGYTPTLGS